MRLSTAIIPLYYLLTASVAIVWAAPPPQSRSNAEVVVLDKLSGDPITDGVSDTTLKVGNRIRQVMAATQPDEGEKIELPAYNPGPKGLMVPERVATGNSGDQAVYFRITGGSGQQYFGWSSVINTSVVGAILNKGPSGDYYVIRMKKARSKERKFVSELEEEVKEFKETVKKWDKAKKEKMSIPALIAP